MWLVSTIGAVVIFVSCIVLVAVAEDEPENNAGPLLQAFGNGKIQTVDHADENIENLDYKKFEAQDPVLQKFTKTHSSDVNEDGSNSHDHYIENPIQQSNGTDVGNQETSLENPQLSIKTEIDIPDATKDEIPVLQKITNTHFSDVNEEKIASTNGGLDDGSNSIESPIQQSNVTDIKNQDTSLENPQLSIKTGTDIPDATKDEIIKQFLLQEIQKPSNSAFTKHEEKQKVLKDLLTNVINPPDDAVQTNHETLDVSSDPKPKEGTTGKDAETSNTSSNFGLQNDRTNQNSLKTTSSKEDVNEYNHVEEVTKEDTLVEDYPESSTKSNKKLNPDATKQLAGENLDHLLSSDQNGNIGILNGTVKNSDLDRKLTDSILGYTPSLENPSKIDLFTNDQEKEDGKYSPTTESSDVPFVDQKEEMNETAINEGIPEIHKTDKGGVSKKSLIPSSLKPSGIEKIDNYDLSSSESTAANDVDSPDNNKNVDLTANESQIMGTKLFVAPDLNGSPSGDQNPMDLNPALSSLTIEQVRSMSDQDLLRQIEENNTIRPEILEKVNNNPDMMRELLTDAQNIPNIADSVDIAGHFTSNTSVDTPVADLLTNNPFSSNTNEHANTSDTSDSSAAVDPRILQAMSDAQLQVALISLLASINPDDANQINLEPTGYGSFLATIGSIDLNIELVPTQSNQLTRKKAKDMFKEVSKTFGNVQSKLPPGTDVVVKAVIKATVPGGPEAIQAAELVAEVIKKQNEAKKNRSLTDDDSENTTEVKTQEA